MDLPDNDSIFLASDDFARSAPWRRTNFTRTAKALTTEQVQDLEKRFAFKPGSMEPLSSFLAHVLDPDSHVLVIHMSRKIASDRAAKAMSAAASELGMAKRKLSQAEERFWALDTRCALNPGAAERMEQLKRTIAHLARETAAALEELNSLAVIPDVALVMSNTRAGPVKDRRRTDILTTLFLHWREHGRTLTYTTDPVLQERRGPLIEFVNAVVLCITDPPSTLPGETIVSDLRAFIKPRTKGTQPENTTTDDENIED